MMKNNIYIDIKNEFKKNISKEGVRLCASQARKIGSNSLCSDSVSISITDSETLKTLNKKYLGEDKTTDVLSFPNKLNWIEGIENIPIEDNFNNKDYLGDVFISFEKIVEHSKLYKTEKNLELNIILAHGILHLLGYDHYDESSRTKINQLTIDIIKNLKLDYKKAEKSLELRNE
tara:strand:- start:1345 stop:1869 length:525 start_codon:yes stop_codon:yes gene_type:complete